MEPFLAANFEDVVGVIVTLAIIGFSVLSQILSDKGKKKKPPPQNQAHRPPPPQQNIESEIEEFLRQARGEAPMAQQRPARSRAQPIEVEPIEVEPMEDEPLVRPGRGFGRKLSDHVHEHIVQDSISQRDAGLASATESADERIEHHLEEVFEHEVGHIAHVDRVAYDVAEGTDANAWEEKTPESATTASDVTEMMKSPDSVRKMFIMTEILRRPDI